MAWNRQSSNFHFFSLKHWLFWTIDLDRPSNHKLFNLHQERILFQIKSINKKLPIWRDRINWSSESYVEKDGRWLQLYPCWFPKWWGPLLIFLELNNQIQIMNSRHSSLGSWANSRRQLALSSFEDWACAFLNWNSLMVFPFSGFSLLFPTLRIGLTHSFSWNS